MAPISEPFEVLVGSSPSIQQLVLVLRIRPADPAMAFQFSLFRNPNAQPGVGVPRSVFTTYANFDGPDRVS